MNNTKVISFISGKGGVGKTSITSSIGLLLYKMGYKVLLIDADLYSHGLTFLLSDKLLDIKNKNGIIENIVLDNPIVDILESKEGINYVASSTDPRNVTSNIVSSNTNVSEQIIYELIKTYRTKEWEYILIDTQPGPVPFTRKVVEGSDISVIISESDALSEYTNLNLLGELHDILPINRIRNVKNKLFYNQKENKKIVEEILSQLNYLPSLPFDKKVIDYLMINEIPINLDDPSPFLFGIISFIKALLPETINKLDDYLKNINSKLISPIEKQISEIQEKITLYENKKQIYSQEKRRYDPSNTAIYKIKELLPAILLILYMTWQIISQYTTIEYSKLVLNIGTIALSLSFMIITAYSYKTKWKYEDNTIKINSEIESINRSVSELYNELDYYNTVLLERKKYMNI